MEKEEIWQSVLAQIQLMTSPANFATWFKNTKISSFENGKVVISVPNSFVKEWLQQKYNKTIFKILKNLIPETKELNYQIERGGLRVLEKKVEDSTQPNQLIFQEFEVNKKTNLNLKYTFSNFVVGSFNELAYAGAMAVVKNPGQVYNPFFVYGGVGLGKTHLLQATGNEIAKEFNKKRVRYVPCEKFVSEVIQAIKNHQIESLKSFYQNFDVLLIDDIQFLSGKEKTQEEFFYIFNTLYEKNKQIVISSDRPPKSIPALAERLRSRFEGGMIADISLPDLETRLAILRAKSEERGVNFSEEILNYIATNIKKNIRELEGALNILVTYQKVNKKFPDLTIAKQLLKNLISPPTKVSSVKKIIKTVADFYEISEKEMLSNSRKKEYLKPRQVAMFLLREELKCSFPFIGRKFGGKDHTTAIHAFNKVMEELKKDGNLVEEIKEIKERIFS
jgi:chromosomal replication initiator protein